MSTRPVGFHLGRKPILTVPEVDNQLWRLIGFTGAPSWPDCPRTAKTGTSERHAPA